MKTEAVTARCKHTGSERRFETNMTDALAVKLLEDVLLSRDYAGVLVGFGFGFGELNLELTNAKLKRDSVGRVDTRRVRLDSCCEGS